MKVRSIDRSLEQRVLVVTPARNEADHLPAVIDAMVAQTQRPALWLIADDGSTDDTAAVAERAAEKHAWIRVLRRADRGLKAGTYLMETGSSWRQALRQLSRGEVQTVAITIPEVPRMVRLVRGVVLTLREQLFVDAAVSLGAGVPRVLYHHIMPNTVAPLIVQATYVCASAIIIEAILGFLGAGTPPDIPSWGNIMAEGRTYFQLSPWIIFYPGIALAITVLSVNILGDGLRDTLDPRIARKM